MKRVLLQGQNLSITHENSPIIRNSSFTIFQSVVVCFCQTNRYKSFFPHIINNPRLAYSGSLQFQGKPVSARNPIKAIHIAGISMFIDSLSIVDNLCLIQGIVPHLPFYNESAYRAKLHEFLSEYGIDIDIDVSTSDLNTSDKYLLLIVKSVFLRIPIVVLDKIPEYCNSSMYPIVRKLIHIGKSQSQTFIILASSRNFLIQECDYIYFCHRRRIVDLLLKEDYSASSFNEKLFGYQKEIRQPSHNLIDYSHPLLEISLPDEWYKKRLLQVFQGEVFGIHAQQGATVSQILNYFLNVFPYTIDGVICESFQEAYNAGLSVIISHVESSYFDCFSDEDNAVISNLRRLSNFGIINKRLLQYSYNEYNEIAKSTYADDDQLFSFFKILYYRCMSTHPKVLLVENPPIDMEDDTQRHFYSLLRDAAASGCAVILITSSENLCLTACNRFLTVYHEVVS